MENKVLYPCDYVNNARDNMPKPLTREYFETLLNDINVQLLCEKVRFLCEEVRENKPYVETYKPQLPAICWQAKFEGKLRTAANAQPTGFFCLDVDCHHEDMFRVLLKEKGVEEAYAWAENEAINRSSEWARMAREEEGNMFNRREREPLNIVAVHVSPSGMGVHVVACCDPSCKSIEENQARLARLLNTSYDAVCKDWPRIFFVTPRRDWTYIDYETLFESE